MFIFQGLLENVFNWLPVPTSKGKASVFTALLAKLLLDQVVALVQAWRDNQDPQAAACPETSTLCFPLSPSQLTCEPGPRLGPGRKPHPGYSSQEFLGIPLSAQDQVPTLR